MSKFVAVIASTININFPSVMDGELFNKSWEYQQYGEQTEAVLVLPMNTTYHLECNGGEPAGLDVIQENLGSLCVCEYDKEHTLGSGLVDDNLLWWDYVVLWDENCGILVNDSTSNFNEDCTWTQMNSLHPNLAQSVQDSIANSKHKNVVTSVQKLEDKENELMTVIVIVCIVSFLIIAAACIIIGALWDPVGRTDDRFNSLAATYIVMNENPQHSISK
eukprot:55440_1